MNRSLANVYALLKEHYGESYTISYAQLPTYLQQLVGSEANDKHIFVRLENRNGTKNDDIPSPTLLDKRNKSSNDLDLTGSPLKDDGIAEISQLSADLKLESATVWKAEEEYQKGLIASKARDVICNEKFQMQKNAGGSVWILCNALDGDKTLFLQYEFSTNAPFSRGIVKFAGFIPAISLNSSQFLLERHNCIIGQKVETFIENVYKMNGDILVRCSWLTHEVKPALIDLKSCDVSLAHIFRLSECGSLTQDFINQMRILICTRNDIIAYKEAGNSSKEPVYQCGCGIEMDELRESINSLMAELITKPDDVHEIDYGIEAVVTMSKLRRLNDLTDNLWILLKRCSSYQSLKAAFNLIFQCAARCGIVNVPTNNNRLAEIITEVSNQRLAIPCLTGTEPLELLLEIGLEKLLKDYEFIFTESKICSPNIFKKTNEAVDSNNAQRQSTYRKSLRNAMKSDAATPRKTLLHNTAGVVGASKPLDEDINCFRNSNFDEYDSGMKLAKLLQIHCALEHLLVLQINLNLQSAFSDISEQLLSQPLKPCDTLEDSFVDQMEISIPVHNNLREYLDGKDPFSRRITFESNNKFRQQKTTFFLCMENVCPPSVSVGFDNEEQKMIKENVYYSWMYQKIQTLRR